MLCPGQKPRRSEPGRARAAEWEGREGLQSFSWVGEVMEGLLAKMGGLVEGAGGGRRYRWNWRVGGNPTGEKLSGRLVAEHHPVLHQTVTCPWGTDGQSALLG